MKLELPPSMVGGEHDTPAQRAYVAALGALPHACAMPPAVLGALMFTVSEEDHQLVLNLMALVTPNFWRAAGRAIEDLDWPVTRPDHVRKESPEFNVQTQLSSSLVTRMHMIPLSVPACNDHARRENAKEIARLASELRDALDEGTGYDSDGRYQGLWLPQPYSAIQQIVGIRHGYRLDWPGESEAFNAVYSVSLQDVLAFSADHLVGKADEPFSGSGSREKPTLHGVIARSLADWFEMIAKFSGNDEFIVPRKACGDTAEAVLRARYPNETILKRPSAERRAAASFSHETRPIRPPGFGSRTSIDRDSLIVPFESRAVARRHRHVHTVRATSQPWRTGREMHRPPATVGNTARRVARQASELDLPAGAGGLVPAAAPDRRHVEMGRRRGTGVDRRTAARRRLYA